MFLAELNTAGWSLGGIWITHGHIDHILGVAAVKRATGAPIYLHPADRPLYDSLTQQDRGSGLKVDPLPAAGPGPGGGAAARCRAGSSSRCDTHTGHSPGSVSFVRQGTIFGATFYSTAQSVGPIFQAVMLRRFSRASTATFSPCPIPTVSAERSRA
jgi:glyoxylase-like metal-dependent hydrolase (beta-lactamase superfamily II)